MNEYEGAQQWVHWCGGVRVKVRCDMSKGRRCGGSGMVGGARYDAHKVSEFIGINRN